MVIPSPYADHDHVSDKSQVVKDNKSGMTLQKMLYDFNISGEPADSV